MNKIQGKGLALVGSIVSTFFTTLGLIIVIVLKIIVNDSVLRSTRTDGMMVGNPNLTRDEAIQLINESKMGFNFMFNILLIGLIIFLILGILGIVLSRMVNSNNKVAVGTIIIIIAFIHVIFTRFVSAALLVAAGIMILSSSESKKLIRSEAPIASNNYEQSQLTSDQDINQEQVDLNDEQSLNRDEQNENENDSTADDQSI